MNEKVFTVEQLGEILKFFSVKSEIGIIVSALILDKCKDYTFSEWRELRNEAWGNGRDSKNENLFNLALENMSRTAGSFWEYDTTTWASLVESEVGIDNLNKMIVEVDENNIHQLEAICFKANYHDKIDIHKEFLEKMRGKKTFGSWLKIVDCGFAGNMGTSPFAREVALGEMIKIGTVLNWENILLRFELSFSPEIDILKKTAKEQIEEEKKQNS